MISIVIPVLNQHEMTHDCINTIRETTPDFELVVIDNGSDPVFKPPFTGFSETVLIRNFDNKGFPAAVNQGIRAASGDVIILLNNDVIVTPGWADRLAGWLDAEQFEITEAGDQERQVVDGNLSFSIVGPLTNYCAGLQRVTLPAYDDHAGLNKEAEALAEECNGEAQAVNFVIGFCMAFKKSIFDEIGPFDESLWPCSGEEIDFCLRARKAGHKIGVAHDVYVHHYGSQTFEEMQQSGLIDYNKIVSRNDKHLADKWGADFWIKQGDA